MGLSIFHISFLQFLGFSIFGDFLRFLAIFEVSVEIWGVLGVLVSYKIIRGIKLVVGRVTRLV